MKKRIICLVLVFALALSAFAVFAACDDNDDTFNIVVKDGGYGTDWINDLVEKFKASHEGVEVKLNAKSSATEVINKNLNKRENTDDLYINVDSGWLSHALQGKLAPLDDIMDDKVDGVALKDKIAPEFANSVYYPDENGDLHTYRLPWVSAIGGIFYNKKMFEENNWKVPSTYDELLALCDTIVSARLPYGSDKRVMPFVYTGQNTDYFDYAVYTWWAQLAGKEAIGKFTEYTNADSFDSEKNPTYAKLKQAVGMWEKLFTDSNYVIANCSGLSNYDAQNMFAQGQAAMMFNGDWVYNELLKYGVDSSKFELGIMKTPTASGAIDPDVTYIVGEDQYIAIPASSKKQDLAKDFIKLIASDEGCTTFINKANGLLGFRMVNSDIDIKDGFMKQLVEVKNGYTSKFTDYPDLSVNLKGSAKQLYLTGTINMWGTSQFRPYVTMLNNGKTLKKAFEDIADGVASQWNDWSKQIWIN